MAATEGPKSTAFAQVAGTHASASRCASGDPCHGGYASGNLCHGGGADKKLDRQVRRGVRMYPKEDREWALYVLEECGGNLREAEP